MNFDQDASWPPEHLSAITGPISTWATWYEGNTDKLATLYGETASLFARPSQFAGGVVGRLARWFWGQPSQAGQQSSKTHVPIARDIARVSAVLLFGEELQIATDDEAAGKRVQEILDGNRWQSLLPEAGEFCAALGGVYLRCGWDSDVATHPLISVVQPDSAIPTFRWGRLSEVTFWQVVRKDGGNVWRHLETHRRGEIEHQLRQGTKTTLGPVVPLDESDATRGLPVDANSVIKTGTQLLTAAYVPNVRPAPLWRDDPVGQHLGCSDFAGLEPRMDELDEAWSNLRREGRLNKTRILVAADLLETAGQGAGAAFNLDREVFVPVNGAPDVPTLPVVVAASTLSVADRLSAIEALVKEIYSDAGYSPSTFGMDGDVAVTATEVASRERKTMSTREMKSRYWTAALEDFLEAVTAIDQVVFNGRQVRPSVVFPASVSPTIGEVGQTVALLNQAQSASIETRVKMLHADWDDARVAEEVARIMAENAMSTPTISIPDPTADANAVAPNDPDTIKAKADAMGVLIRAGVENEAAARQVGMPGLAFRPGATPITIKLPGADGAPA